MTKLLRLPGETSAAPAARYAIEPEASPWWMRRSFHLLLLALAAVPLLYPPIPPLIDLPNHMGRYAVQLGSDSSPALRQWFAFEWQLIGNLGVDLLVELLAPVLGLELAVKLIVILIPVTTTAGFLWTAREVHGRIPVTAALVVPLSYCYPFQFGFVNYCLAMALAVTGYALVLRLTRLDRPYWRAVALLVAGCVTWTAHAYGWAMLGLLWFVTVIVRNWPHGLPKAFARAIVLCLPLAVPLVPMLLWRSGNPVGVDGWFAIQGKLVWLVTILRDRWMVVDLIGAGVIYAVIASAFVWRAKFRMDPTLLVAGLTLIAVAMMLPATIFGSAFADVRLLPYAIATLLVGVAMRAEVEERFVRAAAILVLGFVLVRTALSTASFALYAQSYAQELEALDHVLPASRIAAFSEDACGSPWYDARLRHLANLAIGRNEAFVNGLFVSDGWNAMRVTFDEAAPYTGFPSSMASPADDCDWDLPTVQERIADLPPNAFDYVWLLQVPQERRPSAPALRPVWSSNGSVLYRVQTNGLADAAPNDAAGLR